MEKITAKMGRRKRIVLIAHDNMKLDLLEWAESNRAGLKKNKLYGTGKTGKLLSDEMELSISKFKSEPLGGDQQVGAKIPEGAIDFLIFFWAPLEPLPPNPYIRAFLRIAVFYNIPIHANGHCRFFIFFSLMLEEYKRKLPDYS